MIISKNILKVLIQTKAPIRNTKCEVFSRKGVFPAEVSTLVMLAAPAFTARTSSPLLRGSQ